MPFVGKDKLISSLTDTILFIQNIIKSLLLREEGICCLTEVFVSLATVVKRNLGLFLCICKIIWQVVRFWHQIAVKPHFNLDIFILANTPKVVLTASQIWWIVFTQKGAGTWHKDKVPGCVVLIYSRLGERFKNSQWVEYSLNCPLIEKTIIIIIRSITVWQHSWNISRFEKPHFHP